MKNANFSKLMKLTWALMLGLIFIASSCKKDDTSAPPVVVLDGTYIKGAVTAYPDYDAKAMMKITKNEVTGTDRASLLELYIPIKAGAEGFNIVTVAGSVTTVYGPGAGFATVTKGTKDEPNVAFQRGAVSATSTAKFTVPKDGMYHVAIDLVLLKAVIVPVHWGVIGAATPKGWDGSTQLKESAFNLTSMSWDTTGLTLKKGTWKLRYTNGWKVELDTLIDVGGGKKGVKVNANFGGTPGALIPGGADMPMDAPGFYTVKFAYTLGSGYTLTLTKTGDLPTIDYTNYQMGLIGDAFLKADGVTPANWDEPFGLSKPVVSGKIFTWTYTLNLIAGKDFKFRQGTDWSGKSIGYGDATWAGAGASNFSDNGGNVKVAAAGNYTLVLKIDATTEVYTVTCTKN
jgi:hypothetical protein